jgi:hypothetical protein
MNNRQRFVEGFTDGWSSVLGARFVLPEISAPSIQASGTDYIHGLIVGIEAAKKQMSEMTLRDSAISSNTS